MIPSLYSINKKLREHGVSEEKLKEISKAFTEAQWIHDGQERESKEPYIIHPLAVAQILVDEMGIYDPDAISAALLHDTIEDAKVSYNEESIALAVNPTVAKLVSGVTKLKAMEFSDKEEKVEANTRKLINGLNEDVRIIYIKLADRLHNMRTLGNKKSKTKQIENAIETLEVFVPLAEIVGAYRIKNELEELSLKYIDEPAYNEIYRRREELRKRDQLDLEEMAATVQEKLNERGIKGRIVFREQTVYTIYKKLEKGYKIDYQYDLHYLKIIVPTIPDCYSTVGIIHGCYKPTNGRFKDYIGNVKTNNYQSIHTTISHKGRFWKFKVRTEDMDKIDAYGFPAYWSIENFDNVAPIEYGKTVEETNAIIREKCQSAKKLSEIENSATDNADFFKEIKANILSAHVYVYNNNGDAIELPAGSTALDFVCEVYPDKIDAITSIMVNGIEVMPDTLLKDNDRVQVLEDGKITHENWENYAKSDKAKKKIKEIQRKEQMI